MNFRIKHDSRAMNPTMEKFSHPAPLLNERGSIISLTDSWKALLGICRA